MVRVVTPPAHDHPIVRFHRVAGQWIVRVQLINFLGSEWIGLLCQKLYVFEVKAFDFWTSRF
jgi:hypothetical protein